MLFSVISALMFFSGFCFAFVYISERTRHVLICEHRSEFDQNEDLLPGTWLRDVVLPRQPWLRTTMPWDVDTIACPPGQSVNRWRHVMRMRREFLKTL